jgi:hypothetical protein
LGYDKDTRFVERSVEGRLQSSLAKKQTFFF